MLLANSSSSAFQMQRWVGSWLLSPPWTRTLQALLPVSELTLMSLIVLLKLTIIQMSTKHL